MTTSAGPSTYPSAAIGELLAGAAEAYGQRPVIVDGTTETSYAALYQSALRFANGLRNHGVSHVYRVGLIAPNSADLITAYYGILLAGATVVPVNPAQPRDALLTQLVDLDVRAAVVHADAFTTFVEIAEQTRIDVIITCGNHKGVVAELTAPIIAMAQLIDAQPTCPTLPPVPTKALAHLAFTGGTTGRSKSVQVLHRNVIANVAQLAFVHLGRRTRRDETGLTLGDEPAQHHPSYMRAAAESALAIAPFFHALGLVTLSFFVLNSFTIVPYHGRFDPERYLRAVVDHQITSLTASPPVWAAISETPCVERLPLSTVRIVASGAAPLSGALRARLAGIFPGASVAEAYGLTEATMAIAATPLVHGDPIPEGTVGLALPDTEIQIRGLEDSDIVEAAGENGDVWVRGPQVSPGYVGADEAESCVLDDGWLRTGDIGSVDQSGYLYLHDRAKDMLIYKGYNVYPTELEDVLSHIGGVARVAVVGRPHETYGELPVAFVVPKPGVALSSATIEEHVARRVLPYMRVREVIFVPELPVSPTGKVLKQQLRERLAAQTPNG